MKWYAFILTETNVVELVQGYGDECIVECDDSHYLVEVVENMVNVGDIYNQETQEFSTPI